MALRRWKPFFPAFGAIDTAIEAATEGCSRDKYRQVRSDLVEMLCDCDDDVRAEGLCRLLDRAMAEALLTLRAVPVPVTPTMLAATDITKAVGGLLRHEAGWVRALARGILAQWSSSIEAEAASTEAEGAALDTLLQILCEHEVAAPVTGCVPSGPETTLLQADSMKQSRQDLRPGVPQEDASWRFHCRRRSRQEREDRGYEAQAPRSRRLLPRRRLEAATQGPRDGRPRAEEDGASHEE
jgi:hypothetical protein